MLMKSRNAQQAQANKLRIWLCAMLLLLQVPTAAALTTAEKLTLTARVWGIAKYRHPQVTSCARNWDQVLINALPGIEASADDAQFDQQIGALLNQAGSIASKPISAQTPAWIANAALSSANQATLAAIAANRPSKQCYVKSGRVGTADFTDDNAFSINNDQRSVRILAAFRYWNAAEYFFAYRDLIGEDWAAVLERSILPIADAQDDQRYHQLMRQFTAKINDSHTYFYGPYSYGQYGPPFTADFVEGKVLVVAKMPDAAVSIGDEVVRVNDLPIAEQVAERELYSFGSNPVFKRSYALQTAFDEKLLMRRADGTQYEYLAPRGFAYTRIRANTPGWQPIPASATRSCNAAVLSIDRYAPNDRNALSAALRNLDLLVVDARYYPTAAFQTDDFSGRLLGNTSLVSYSSPDFKDPGAYLLQSVNYRGNLSFNGKVIVVVGDQTLSSAEFQTMMLQALPGTIVIGSQTAGGDGDIQDTLRLPGGIRALFSSNRLLYTDGRQSQRVGIVPDVHVTRTIAGVRAGRDEVLEAALDCRWKTETPAPREPKAGLYFSATRNGEGLDIQRSTQGLQATLYSFAADGQSQWASTAASALSKGIWNAPLLRSRRAAATPSSSVSGQLKLDFQRGPYQPACAIAEQHLVPGRATIAWPPANPNRELCVQPLFLGESSRSGRYVTNNDADWHLSLHQQGDTIVAFVNALDANGDPRWLIGVGSAQSNSAELALMRVTGFCESCTASASKTDAAGTLSISFADDGAATVSVDAELIKDQARFSRSRVRMTR
jgi:hypothetical protein